jgi:hypothetical protein
MALTMAVLWRDRTGVWYLRQRTPQDLLGKLQGQSVTLPIGDGFAAVKVRETVQASLRTKDNREAKERHAVADAALRRFWTAQRAGPVRLTHRQVVALASTGYKEVVGEWQEDPVDEKHWHQAYEELREARSAANDQTLSATERMEQLEEAHGFHADHILSREKLVVGQDARTRLLLVLAGAVEDAVLELRRNARGDYRPNPDADRFPAWVPPRDAEEKSVENLTVTMLTERWAEFQADKLAANSLKRYGTSQGSLAAFTKDR